MGLLLIERLGDANLAGTLLDADRICGEDLGSLNTRDQVVALRPDGIKAVKLLLANLDGEDVGDLGGLADLHLRASLGIVDANRLIQGVAVSKFTNHVTGRRLQGEDRDILDLVLYNLHGSVDVVLPQLFCGIRHQTLPGSNGILLLLCRYILLKLASATKLTASGKLDDTLNEGASKCASARVAEKVLTNFHVGVVNAVLHKIVGDTGGGFLRTLRNTGSRDLRETALDDPLNQGSLGCGNLAEYLGERPEEPLKRERL